MITSEYSKSPPHQTPRHPILGVSDGCSAKGLKLELCLTQPTLKRSCFLG